MLFEISTDLQAVRDPDFWRRNILPIHNLLEAHRQERHIAALPADFADYLRSLGIFGEVLNNVLLTIGNEESQSLGVAKSLPLTCLVIGDDAPVTRDRANQDKIIRLSALNNSGLLERFCLVVENGTYDFELYKALSDCLSWKVFSYEMNIDVDNGGGSGLAFSFQRQIAKGRPFVCIVDSDRITPHHPIGGTASSVMNAVERCGVSFPCTHVLAEVIYLPIHEAENLIPPSLIKDVYSGNGDVIDKVDVIERIHDLDLRSGAKPEEMFYSYLDLKSGIIVEHWSSCPNAKAREFVEIVAKSICPAFYIDEYTDKNTVLVPGISENLLRNLCTHLKNNRISRRKLLEEFNGKIRKSALGTISGEIGDVIFSYSVHSRFANI